MTLCEIFKNRKLIFPSHESVEPVDDCRIEDKQIKPKVKIQT